MPTLSDSGAQENKICHCLHISPFYLLCSNGLQCSCLENPRDRGAWWAAIYGVAQSWTQLKRLSSSSSRSCDCHSDGIPGCNAPIGFIDALAFLRSVAAAAAANWPQSCPTLSDPMDCSLPGSSVHGIFQARVLEWGAIAFLARAKDIWPIYKNQLHI